MIIHFIIFKQQSNLVPKHIFMQRNLVPINHDLFAYVLNGLTIALWSKLNIFVLYRI